MEQNNTSYTKQNNSSYSKEDYLYCLNIRKYLSNIHFKTGKLETIWALLTLIPGLPIIFFLNWIRKNPIQINKTAIKHYKGFNRHIYTDKCCLELIDKSYIIINNYLKIIY